MKICPHCSEPYRDHVDFCFNDGEVLRAPSAGEVLAVVSDARAIGARSGAAPAEAVPALDPALLALVAQVEDAVKSSVVTVRRERFRAIAARRRAALARIGAPSAFAASIGCLVFVVAVAAPVIGGMAYLAGSASAPPHATVLP